MITANNLVKIYADNGVETRALDGVSFTIQQGEFVAIMGPSGSGKSTLLHILSFLDRPTSGDYIFSEKNSNELTDKELAHYRNAEMGFVFQAFNLLARASVFTNVELPLLYSAVPVTERQARVEQAIAAIGLTEKILVEASKLSGGQKQRVAMARALVNNPNVIFADEPTGNLDSVSGKQVMEILRKLNEQGKTIILVTHEMNIARYARRLIKIGDGLVVADGRITDLLPHDSLK